MVPIWKDYSVDLSSYGDAVTWRVVTGGSEIFRGVAEARPDGTNAVVLNDICADYLRQTLPASFATTGVFSPADVAAGFTVQRDDNGVWTDVETVTFAMDWSYDDGWDVETLGLNFPVRKTLDSRLPLIVGNAAAETVTLSRTTTGGTVVPVALVFAAPGNVVVSASTLRASSQVSLRSRIYPVAEGCGRYALAYVNAFGGWDLMTMDRGGLMSDQITRNTAKRTYDNADPAARGTVNYRNDIARSWRLGTGPLTDDESERMHHLIESTQVFLIDIPAGAWIPVTVSDAGWDCKTYRNQGRRLFDYTVTVAEARNRERR